MAFERGAGGFRSRLQGSMGLGFRLWAQGVWGSLDFKIRLV